MPKYLVCKTEGCRRKVVAKGMCARCYHRWYARKRRDGNRVLEVDTQENSHTFYIVETSAPVYCVMPNCGMLAVYRNPTEPDLKKSTSEMMCPDHFINWCETVWVPKEDERRMKQILESLGR